MKSMWLRAGPLSYFLAWRDTIFGSRKRRKCDTVTVETTALCNFCAVRNDFSSSSTRDGAEGRARPPSASSPRRLHAAPLYVLMMSHLCFLAWHLRLHVLSELSRPPARPVLNIYVSDTVTYVVAKAPNFPVVLDTSFPLAPHISSSCGFFLQNILYPGTVPVHLHRHHPNSQDPSSPSGRLPQTPTDLPASSLSPRTYSEGILSKI